jgi:hypothetical protein
MKSAQELVDEISSEEMNYSLDANNPNELLEVSQELQNAIYQELTIPFEDRNIYWAQTLIDSV